MQYFSTAHTSCFRYLPVKNCSHIQIDQLEPILSIMHLNLIILNNLYHENFRNFLRNMPNLHHFKVELNPTYPSIDGRFWEQIVRNNLSNFEGLQFLIHLDLPDLPDEE
ncbi:unnamed protein product [Rotaria sp. Silwood1]|nr:unnamed protein product [Rotaria sp. Silwood1]CAF3813913.1 unnamed protein product [Rotaria sp. Silwood1]CAF3901948.1 unnamed protein product [Rotaria sp. Silwood1]CAF5003006.1 unnamed protein product [Rotaria sp. Silwood1]CAF5104176.1 unnamed protein product [Rotaria sp. Silwood1]